MKPDFIETLEWKGRIYHREYYKCDDFSMIPADKAFQSQAVCFLSPEKVILYEDLNGHRGMPGGHIEMGESFEETLKREIFEESACKVLALGPTAYIKEWEESDPGEVKYALRYWAVVKPVGEIVEDPCHEGRFRIEVDLNVAAKMLGWGESADFLLKIAKEGVIF